jgi:delta8-fatty-acid desaturase
MTAYRIGRAPADWTNFAPPIRGGVFRPLSAKEAVKEKEEIWVEDVLGTHSDRDEAIDLAMQFQIDKCLAAYPSVDATTQNLITEKYNVLHQKVHDGGFYKTNYLDYGRESIRYTILFITFLTLLHRGWYIPSAIALGAFWQQIMFSAHDAGHRAITQNMTYDTMIGIFIADFCCGLSFGWWKSSHNVHHLITNHPEHDPDIQNTPLFATCPSQFRNVHSTYYNFDFVWDKACEIMLPYQKYAYYPIMAFARFNLYALGWMHLISPRSKHGGAAAWARPAEIVGMATYWFVFGYLLVWRTLPDWPTRVAFVLTSHLITMLLHVQITLSHWGMPTCDLGDNESFAQKQLRTTMDVLCPIWLDWLHGGLQFQAIHHLFPRVPRHNLRKIQPMVKEFCQETGIQYTIYGFVKGNGTVISRLDEISAQLAMLVKCQDHMAKTGDSGLI